MSVNLVDLQDLKRYKGGQKERCEGPALVLPTLPGVCESEGEERFGRRQRVSCYSLNTILSNFQQLKICQYDEVARKKITQNQKHLSILTCSQTNKIVSLKVELA